MTEAGPMKKNSAQKCDQMGTTNPFGAFMPNIPFPPNSTGPNEKKIVPKKRKTDAQEGVPVAKQLKNDAKEGKPVTKQGQNVPKKGQTESCDEKSVAKKGKTDTQEGKFSAKNPDVKKVTGNADVSFYRPII